MIDGVRVVPLRRIPDERGTVYHMLKRTDPHFIEFGEIYFSTVYRSVVKGWHRHREMTLNYACVSGQVHLVLYDARAPSPTRGQVQELTIGGDRYALVRVPPGIWNGFKGLGTAPSIVANCATIPHDPREIVRIPPDDPSIPYDWARVAP